MDIRKLQRAIVDGLEEVKGQNIVVFNTEHLSPLFERVIIASGTSNRQTRALAASVRDAVKSKGFGLSRTEGAENGEWIIVDCGAAVVHLMQPTIRDYYHLEEIWGDKPVRLKLDSSPKRLVKAAEPDARPAVAAKKSSRRISAVAKPSAPSAVRAKTPVPTSAQSATPAVARKRATSAGTRAEASAVTPAKRTAPRKAVTRVVGVKRSVAGSVAAKAPAQRKSPAVKSATKRAAKASTSSAGKTVRRKT
ncbi:MAG: ribosome silencing factor [Burkholderiales bacterium]